jgi:hypothetical protein
MGEGDGTVDWWVPDMVIRRRMGRAASGSQHGMLPSLRLVSSTPVPGKKGPSPSSPVPRQERSSSYISHVSPAE